MLFQHRENEFRKGGKAEGGSGSLPLYCLVQLAVLSPSTKDFSSRAKVLELGIRSQEKDLWVVGQY